MLNVNGSVQSSIEEKCSEIEEKTGLRIFWIKTASELTAALRGGLTELYQEVFADPPYNESFSVDEVREGFECTLAAHGLVFTAVDPQTGNPVAFVSSAPVRSETSVSNVVTGQLDTDKFAYFAEDGVAKQWRRHGLSANMKKLLLSSNFLLGFDGVVLRTSIYNYPQIAAVSKSGGVVIPDLSQDVASTRSDGSVHTDRRAFYLFDKLWSERANGRQTLQRVTIARPGGNDTAIVWDAIDRQNQRDVSLDIQKTYPGVEQVMFVERTDSVVSPRGQMAGGEFCGNATRSFGYLMLDRQDGALDVEVSGASRPLGVEVRHGFSKTQIPILSDLECVKPVNGAGEYLARLEGISFLITYEDAPEGRQLASLETLDAKKQRVLEILGNYKLLEGPASGLLVLKPKENGELHLDPYVYVRDTGTLYYESGCGSGSTAVGLMLAKKSGNSVNDQKIVQPSGMGLYVSVRRDAERFLSASVNGPIEILLDGRMHMAKSYPTPALGS